MIAAFDLYACVLSLIIGALALWLERGAKLLRASTRFVWIGAMIAIIIVPAALFARGVWRAGEPSASERSVAPTVGSRPDVARAGVNATNAPEALNATERHRAEQAMCNGEQLHLSALTDPRRSA